MFERLRASAFAVLGRAGMDLYATPPGTPQDEAETFYACLGGSAGNIAAGLARQGAAVDLLSAVSDDGVGRFTLNALRKFGIGADHVRIVGGEARTNLAVVDTLGDRTTAVIYRNEAADFSLSTDDIASVDVARLGALVVTGTALVRDPSRTAAHAALERAREAGAVTVLDVDYRPYSWSSPEEARAAYTAAAALTDLVVGNDVEFGVMAGDYARGRDIACAIGQAGRTAIYKMGANGAETYTAGRDIHTPVFAVEALKPTGAGDAFLSSLLSALASGEPLEAALRWGAAAAAIVVTRVGCSEAMPTAQEISAFLAERG